MTEPAQIHWQSAPAAERRAVLVPTDAHAFPFAFFLASQMAERETARRFDIVVCIDDRTAIPEPLRGTQGIRFLEVGKDKRVEALPRTRKISRVTYFWIILIAALREEYDRLLFLDADIYMRKPGLDAVLDGAMPHPIGAAPDGVEYVDRGDTPTHHHTREGLPARYIYRNGGAELVDVPRALAAGLPDRMLSYRAEQGRSVKFLDQSALNGGLAGDITLLSPRYNFMTLPSTLHLLEEVDPLMLHFIDNPKPWVRVPGWADSPYHDEYAAFLHRHFGQDDLARRGIWGQVPARPNWSRPLGRLDWYYYRGKKRRLNAERRQLLEDRPKVPLSVIRRLEAAADIR